MNRLSYAKNNYFFYVLIISVTLTLLPILNIIKMINYGDNNLSDDYIKVVLPVTEALDGQLGLKDFIVKSWFRAHFSPVTMIVILVLGGFQSLMLGAIGEYLWRTMAQVQNRDMYIVNHVYENT